MFKPLKKYNIVTTEDFEYSRANMPLEEAKKSNPEYVVTVPKGTVVWSQDNSFTLEQIKEAIAEGLVYQFGFGPAYTKIPYSKLVFTSVEFFKI